MREDVKLPDNMEELANFFNQTDTQELEWEDTDVEFKRPELVHVSVRITKEDLAAIKKAARKLGVGHTTYIRMILRKAAGR